MQPTGRRADFHAIGARSPACQKSRKARRRRALGEKDAGTVAGAQPTGRRQATVGVDFVVDIGDADDEASASRHGFML